MRHLDLFPIFARVVLPPLLGAGGALLAAATPAYYAAMCGSYVGL